MFCAHFQHDLGYNHQTLWIYVFLYIFYFSKKKQKHIRHVEKVTGK